jgi:integrase/recombinase XerD
VDPARIDKVLAVIPRHRLRDRVLFGFLKYTGVRASEGLGLYVEDLTLTADDEHVRIHGKGGRIRTHLLDEAAPVVLLRRYLRQTGYTPGPLFRAGKNWTGGPLRYSSAEELWARYREIAGEPQLEMHQLRHTHATELTKDRVNVRIIRKRLGHRKIQTTLGYADHPDHEADADLRARQRRR